MFSSASYSALNYPSKHPHCLIILFLLIIVFNGCAVKTQTVSLSVPADMDIMKCGDAMSTTLGIAPVVDKRPEHERTGKKPKGVYLGVWNQRIGDYITSDLDFAESVPEAIVKQFQQAIEKSNCFFEAKILEGKIPAQPRAEDLLVAFAKYKTRYILTSEVEHFYGTQSQTAHLAVIPAVYVNAASMGNNVGVAQGFTEILFTLYDTQLGYEIWRQKIETMSDTAVEGAYPQAAKESLIEASEKLAHELYHYTQSLSSPTRA